MKDGTGIFYYYFLFNHFYHMRWNTAEQGSNLSMFLQRTHPGFEPATTLSTEGCSPNGANQAAVSEN